MPREFKRILCPTDFSEESYRAMEYAERFAREANGSVLLAHVIHIPSGELRDEFGHMLKPADAKRRATERLSEAHRQRMHGYPNCELHIDFGVPGEHLIALAAQRKIDLIVLSTHGHSRFDHILVGSVTEEILRHAPCPVFVVRRGAD